MEQQRVLPNVGVIGSGEVGRTLAAGFLAEGYAVMLGTRDPAKAELIVWQGVHPSAQLGTFEGAADFGAVLVLAVSGGVAGSAVQIAGAERLAGKVVIDATNPIADAPPANGVLQFFTGPNESLMERLQALVPAARWVKAFNSVGSGLMHRPRMAGGVRPTMFICGDDADAKQTVTGILERFGWEAADFGRVESARPIEALCQLWCVPAMTEGRVTHAFHLLGAVAR